MAALKQRNEELEQTLQQDNLLILALNTMIETAEEELNVSIRKKSGRIGGPNQTVLTLRENEIAKVSVGSLCRLFDGPPMRCEPTSFSRKKTTFPAIGEPCDVLSRHRPNLPMKF